MVTSVVGIIVAVVSGVFGISAHGLAAGAAGAGGIGAAALPPTSGDLLMVGAASAGIGAVTAALARRRPPVLTAAAGLLAGQGLVHLVLSSGASHAHAGRVSAGGVNTGGVSAGGALGHHTADPAAVRAAMDGSATGMSGAAGIGGTGAGGGHLSSLLTPEMLGAHVAAVAVTLGLVAILSRTLSWVAARVSPLLGRVRVVVVVPLLSSYDALAPRARYLLVGGGTRAPPALV